MLPDTLQGDASSSTTASMPRIMERAPALHEITPEQAAAAILQAVTGAGPLRLGM